MHHSVLGKCFDSKLPRLPTANVTGPILATRPAILLLGASQGVAHVHAFAARLTDVKMAF
jgi:hypothetical protein